MPRFEDVMNYLDQNYATLGLAAWEKQKFSAVMRDGFSRHTDDVLSLNWNRFDRQRPDSDSRVEIRLCLLAAICRKGLSTAQAKQYVTTKKSLLKTKSKWELDTEAVRLIRKAIGTMRCSVEAAALTLRTAGDPDYAQANSVFLGQTVDEYIETYSDLDQKLAVMLIDMQTHTVGHEMYGGQTGLEHQKAVLELAAERNLRVYDITIDSDHAKGIQQQTKFTVPELRDAAWGARVTHISKPNHPSFIGTDLAKILKKDQIRVLVVMGFHAGQCVKGTIFGGPESKMSVSAKEKEDFLEKTKSSNTTWVEGKGIFPYVPGLLDRGYTVVTSRAVLASDGAKLEPNYGVLAGM